MIFSAGAYALGAGLTATKLMGTLTKAMMDGLGLASMELLQSVLPSDRNLYRKSLHFPKQEHEDDYFHADRYRYCAGIEN